MKTILLLFLIPFACAGQKLIYNTDLKRGNGNQWIYVDALGRQVKEIYNSVPLVIITTAIPPVKNAFTPTPASASIAGFIMMDSVINGKKVSIIKEDLNDYDTLRPRGNVLIGLLSGQSLRNKNNNVAIGSSAFGNGYESASVGASMQFNRTGAGSSAMMSDDDTPKPGEKLQLCRYCDMMRTLAHRIYIAKMMGSGYVQISKGVWAYTN